jgi:hypothetical protein
MTVQLSQVVRADRQSDKHSDLPCVDGARDVFAGVAKEPARRVVFIIIQALLQPCERLPKLQTDTRTRCVQLFRLAANSIDDVGTSKI